jgi:hypothetical protein
VRLRQLALVGIQPISKGKRGEALADLIAVDFDPRQQPLHTRDFPNSKNPHNALRMILSFEKLHAWGLKLNGCLSALNAHEL